MAKVANSKQAVNGIVSQCTMVFKSYGYHVVESKSRANLWHFSVTKDEKKYVIYCTTSIAKVQGIIKVALKKLPKESKFVVICNEFTQEDQERAKDLNYSISNVATIKKYGIDMLEARQREEESLS